MKLRYLILVGTAVCALSNFVDSAFAQGTAFTYQGQLVSNGVPANGNYDVQFSLYAASSGGSATAGPVIDSSVGVSNGLFTTIVDFGPGVFVGQSNWLDIAVRQAGIGSFVELTPRQQLTPAPGAIYAENASNLLGGISASQLPAAAVTNGDTSVTLSGSFTGNGTGLTNVPGTLTQVVTSGNTLATQPNTAYNLSNSTTVAVNLPGSANVGDIIQVTAPVGGGGWEVAADNYFLWTPQTNGFPPSPEIDSLAGSSDGTHLLAGISAGGLYLSVNSGATWTLQTGLPANPAGSWYGLALDTGGIYLAAAVDGGAVYLSPDGGATWTEQLGIPTNGNWASLCSSGDGSHLVAGAETGLSPGGIYVTTNRGATWIQATSGIPPNGAWASVACSGNASNVFAINIYSGIYGSTDGGITWVQKFGQPATGNWINIATSADGSHVAAVAYAGSIYLSSDGGTTWAQSPGAPAGYLSWESIASSADGSHLAAVAFAQGIYTSADYGMHWALQTVPPPGASWYGITSSADGSHLAAAAAEGAEIYTGVDSISGAAGTSEQFQYLGNGVWQPLPPVSGSMSSNVINALVNVVTNGESGVTLNGAFSGDGSGLYNINGNSITGNVYANNTPAVNYVQQYNALGNLVPNNTETTLSISTNAQASSGYFVIIATLNGNFQGNQINLNLYDVDMSGNQTLLTTISKSMNGDDFFSSDSYDQVTLTWVVPTTSAPYRIFKSTMTGSQDDADYVNQTLTVMYFPVLNSYTPP